MSKISFTLRSVQLLVLFVLNGCEGNGKVKLGVYLESLCPDSRSFVNEQLTPTFNILSQIFDVDLVPFGNSEYTYNTTTKEVLFKCQHGFQECYGNKIHVYKSI
jgi:hypothetical protein